MKKRFSFLACIVTVMVMICTGCGGGLMAFNKDKNVTFEDTVLCAGKKISINTPCQLEKNKKATIPEGDVMKQYLVDESFKSGFADKAHFATIVGGYAYDAEKCKKLLNTATFKPDLDGALTGVTQSLAKNPKTRNCRIGDISSIKIAGKNGREVFVNLTMQNDKQKIDFVYHIVVFAEDNVLWQIMNFYEDKDKESVEKDKQVIASVKIQS